MLFFRHYGICARPELRHAPGVDPEFADYLCDETLLIRIRQGGRTAWSHDDYLSKLKLLFLAKLKVEYEEPFVRDAPLSTEFFDQWWTAQPFDDVVEKQDILDNFDPSWATKAPSTGRSLVDSMLRRLAERQ